MVVAFVVIVIIVVVVRTGVLFRWPAFMRWRIEKSRRERGMFPPGPYSPSDNSSDPSAGL